MSLSNNSLFCGLQSKKRLQKKCQLALVLLTMGCMAACTQAPQTKKEPTHSLSIVGDWILEQDGSSMIDPQTSGLSYYQGMLLSVSDGSADNSQIQKLHQINPQTGAIMGRLGPIQLADKVKDSCFVSYLSTRPDYEALVSVPNKQDTWLLVTEDATRAGDISDTCQQRFANTGSTYYPTLIVQVELIDSQLMLTGVRALQFAPQHQLGDFPNDGIEGMAITRDSKVLLGLEKDANTQARVFELALTDNLFDSLDEFVRVDDSQLLLPAFSEGNHPINGMDVYYPDDSDQGYLIAAARNDDQLWILDLKKQKTTKILDIKFAVNCRLAIDVADGQSNALDSNQVASTHPIANTALEGVAVSGETLYLINDPWKRVYADNTTCANDQDKYDRMSPMLFSLPIDKKWFQ
jgi:WD40 repeat protein